jgi:hypothetical protein
MNKKLEEDMVGYVLQACIMLRYLTERLCRECHANPYVRICASWLASYLEYLNTYLGRLAELVRRAVRKDRKALHKTIRLACDHLVETRRNLQEMCNKEDKHG